MRHLIEGESRKLRPSKGLRDCFSKFQVIAEAEDNETPFIYVVHDGNTLVLTDVDAEELSKQLKRALSILPTSK